MDSEQVSQRSPGHSATQSNCPEEEVKAPGPGPESLNAAARFNDVSRASRPGPIEQVQVKISGSDMAQSMQGNALPL
jgi:hypothetical protein